MAERGVMVESVIDSVIESVIGEQIFQIFPFL